MCFVQSRRRPPPSVVAAEGRQPCIGSEQSTWPSSQHSTCLASQQGRRLGSQQGTCLTSQHKDMPSVHSQHKGNQKGGRPKAAPPLWRRPKAASFVLAVNTGHIVVLRRKICALLSAKTSALLRRKTHAVLRGPAWAWVRLGPGPGLGPGPAWARVLLGPRSGLVSKLDAKS